MRVILAMAMMAWASISDAEPLIQRLKFDSLKIVDAQVDSANVRTPVRLAVMIENRSGTALRVGLMEDGVVVGGCTTTSSIAGIPQITGPAKEAIRDKAERKRLLVLLQDGGRLGVAAVMKDCEHILGSKTAQKVLASITLVVADDDDFENVPIVADATVK